MKFFFEFLVEVEGKIAIYQRRQTRQLILMMFVVVGVFYCLLLKLMISYADVIVVVIVLFLVAVDQPRIFTLHLMRLPHLRQVSILFSKVFQLSFDVDILGFQRFRLAH